MLDTATCYAFGVFSMLMFFLFFDSLHDEIDADIYLKISGCIFIYTSISKYTSLYTPQIYIIYQICISNMKTLKAISNQRKCQ